MHLLLLALVLTLFATNAKIQSAGKRTADHCGKVDDSCLNEEDPPCCPDLFCLGICKSCAKKGASCNGFDDPPCCPPLFCKGGKCQKCRREGGACGGVDDPPCCVGQGTLCHNGRCRKCLKKSFTCGRNTPACCKGLFCGKVSQTCV